MEKTSAIPCNHFSRICVITGTRADYGLLKNVISKIKMDNELELQIIVTGSHTSEKYGLTYHYIIEDGFNIDRIIPMELNDDSAKNIVAESGKELIGMSSAFASLKPDMIVVLGDRYEILIAVYAATIFNIKICHICGGDITEYAYDDNIRHAITKMSHLHFTTHTTSSNRIIQMGETSDNVYCCGNPGLEDLHNFTPYDKETLCKNLNIKLNEYNFLVIFHPVTLLNNLHSEFAIIERVLEYYLNKPNYNLFLLFPNSDNNNNIIINSYNSLSKYNNCYLFDSLKRFDYLSLASHMDLFIGNSSSGIYEMPVLQIPVINIGNRQEGRLISNGIENTDVDYDMIIEKISSKLIMDKSTIKSVYPTMNSSELIINKIKEYLTTNVNVKKFADIIY